MRGIFSALAAVATTAGFLAISPGAASAATPTTLTTSFGFTNTVQHFTVPSGVTSITLTALGGKGSWGGTDSSGPPPAGGYQGEVTGTISVTPGQYLTIAVGSGGNDPVKLACTGGGDSTSPTDNNDAVGGVNPLSQYNGGKGGAPGSQGCSGYGGSGGAATVIEVGSSAASPADIATIVAAGGGGDGGSGQFILVRGQIGLANYVTQSTPTAVTYTLSGSSKTIYTPSPLPANATQGQDGTAVFAMCGGGSPNQYFATGASSCDGGGGAGGGGGAAGGAAGSVQFGSGSSNEWYGQGGSPGQNATGGLAGLSAFYSYYSDYNPTAGQANTFVDPGAQYDGSVTLTFASGVPGAPTGVAGTAANSGVALQWTAPSSPGAADISDYVVQYSGNGGSTWTSVDIGSTATSADITGLTNGTGYIFQVEAVNSYGDGPWSASSGTVTPSGPPGAPTITAIASQDGALRVGFTPPASVAPVTGYLYQLDGSGPWVAATGTSSPLSIAGLTDGTAYSVQIEAVNVAGAGAPSNPMSGTPAAVPGAPTITSVQVGPGTASVSFTPGNTGGADISGYRYSLDHGTTWTAAPGSSPISISGLSAATGYDLQLEAINSTGNGAAATASFTTPSAPDAPVLSLVQAGDHTLRAQFPAPAAGGYPITDFQWSTDGGATWSSEADKGRPCVASTDGSTDTCAVDSLSTDGTTALNDGTTYSLEFRAVNAVGAGPASNPIDATPATTPGAPTITTGSDGMVAADQALTVSFSAPGSDGGSAVTGYQYSTDAGATWHDRTDGQTATTSPMTISALSADGVTPLVNGQTYSVEIRALNSRGAGPGSDVATGIPARAPSAPRIDLVTGLNGGLSVSFTPGSNGGAVVTSYQYSLDGGDTWTSTGSLAPTFTIGGLANGTAYPVQIEAVNPVGTSDASGAVQGTPVTAPAQPSITSTSRANGSISLSFSESSDGGSPVTSYQYSTDSGATWSDAGSATSPITVTALSTDGSTPVSNGTEYPVEIRAVNAVGTSLPSNPIQVAPAGVPAPPTVGLTPGNGSVAVTATVTDDGGAPVTGMDYSLNLGPWLSTGTSSSAFTISGLTNGTTYTVAVRADNAIGNGGPSPAQNVKPSTVPAAPSGVVATGDANAAVVSWTSPTSDGGSPIVSYTATAYTSAAGTTPVGTPCTTATLSCTVTGLTNGTTYYVGVVATNTNGAGQVSSPLQAVTPLARPSAPAISTITPGNTFLSVAFTAGSAGGKPISSYQYSLDGGSTWVTASGTSSPIVISGLTNGTAYLVALRAVSAVGAGAASSAVSATPANYPDPVDATTIFANGENGQAVISWTVPYNEGSAITQAQATAFTLASGGTQAQTCTTTSNLTTGSTASCTLSPLTNGTTYYISIQSQNAAGWSSRSTPRVAVTPSINPGPASTVVATAGNGQASVTWKAGSQGASPVSDYTLSYSSDGGTSWTPVDTKSTATSASVTALTNGTAYIFEVYAVNANGTGPASAVSNAVTPHAPISLTSDPFGSGEVGLAYDQAPASSGGTGTITWSLSNGSLPPGLSLDGTTGEVTGTPTAAGTYDFTIQAADAYSDAATQDETVNVVEAPAVISPLLDGGEVGVSYDATPSAVDGVGTYTWSVTGGSLPAGLTLDTSTGEISGTPTSVGTSAFTLVVTDGNGQSASQDESVAVAADPSITSPAFGGGEMGAGYDALPAVSDGVGPFSWSVTGGSLPAGLKLDSSSGEISGTPTSAGTSTFTLMVTDGNGQTASQDESVAVAAGPSITSPALSGGEVGVAYDASPVMSDGVGPFTWSVTGGSLPAGLQLDTSTGEVSGTPTSAGTSAFTLVVTDGNGQTASQDESVAVAADPSITSPALGGAEVGAAYDGVPAVSDGVGPFAWSVTAGSLPAGLHLNSATGEISGTPTAAGTSAFTLAVTDGNGKAASQAESIRVVSSPTLSVTFANGVAGLGYDAKASVTGGTGPYTWSITGGSLPTGLTLNASTGEVSGTPTTAGSYSFNLVVTDGKGEKASKAVSMRVDAVETGGATAATPSGDGYWTLDLTGSLSTHGSAVNYGSMKSSVTDPVVGISADTLGTGYWETTSSGKVAAFGRAGFFGSAANIRLDQPIVGITHTADDRGYWLAGRDGGVFAYGDARFYGSMGATRLNRQIVGIVATPDGHGYWLVAADGGVFSFGDARFWGSLGNTKLARPIVGMAATPDGHGYWLVASDGGVFAFGDAHFFGSKAGSGAQIVGVIAHANTGYRLTGPDGTAYRFGSV